MMVTGFSDLSMTDVPTFNCFSSRWREYIPSAFFNSPASLRCPCHCPSSFLSSFSLYWVVSFPHDQHFCCLCFLLHLWSPSFLSSPSHSCMREWVVPCCGDVRVSNSRASFYSLLSSTMGLKCLLQNAHTNMPGYLVSKKSIQKYCYHRGSHLAGFLLFAFLSLRL